jgi:radical SAM protein with 4Fe4S-binding SPASM domain
MITIGRDNIDHIEDILQLSCELGIRRKINYDFVQAIYARDTVSPYDILAWKQKIDKLESGEYGGRLTLFYERERTEYSNTCGAGTTMVTMDPHGDVRPCTYLPAEYITGGNLFESDFPSIFQSPMSEQLKTLEFPGGDTCKDCEFFHHCKGCFCNGVLMYEDVREKCMWGASHNLEEWINFP